MKIGFSSLVCPGWDLTTIVAQAAELGFQGVELRGLRGELHLPLAAELAADPAATRAMFAAKNIELVCLASSATLVSRDRRELARQKAQLSEFIELAGRLGCGLVRIFAGEIGRWDNRRAALARITAQLHALVPIASRCGVTILVENSGDFAESQDLWHIVDGVDHPSVRACWSQCYAMVAMERPTVSLPRLGARVGLVHLADAEFDSQGVLLGYRSLGDGQCEVARQIELLKGMAYGGFVVFEWPKLWVPSLPEPADVLPGAATWLKAQISATQPVLSAYKGDKNAPKFACRPAASAGR